MSKSSQIEYSECMTLVTMVVTIYMCEYWKKNIYIIHRYKNTSFRVRAISLSFLFTFLSCVYIFLSVSFHFLPCSFHFHQSYLCFTFILFNFPPFLLFFHVSLMFLWFPFPIVSFSFSSFLSCPFHFILLSLQFLSLFPSSHSIFLVCTVILKKYIEYPRIFVPNYVHGPWFFSWSSLLVYASGCQFIMW